MRSWIESRKERQDDPSPAQIAALVADEETFWLDIEDPTEEIIDRLAARLALHPLAVEDSKTFGQRGKLQTYGNIAMLVGFGLDPASNSPIEVHAYVSSRFVLTLHQQPIPAFEDARTTGSIRSLLGDEPARMLHHLIGRLHDDFPPVIDRLDEQLGRLATEVLRNPDDLHLVEIAEVNQIASTLRRTLAPGRDLAVRTTTVMGIPGFDEASRPYIEDISDALQQIVNDFGALEERCLALRSLHTSLASNRQNAASRQLAVVATIFLPITFLVSFFGQNFSVLTTTIQVGWVSFVLLGLGLNAVCVVMVIVLLGRRGLR